MSDSIREDTLAAMEAVEKLEAEATKPVVEAPTSETIVAETKESKARDEAGKFAAKEPKEATEAKPAAEPKVADETVKTETKPDAPKSAEPPANWSQADKEMFAKQPPEAQKFLLDRHTAMTADYTRKTQEISALKNEFQPVVDLLAPHSEAMRQRGLTPGSLIQGWYAVEKRLSEGQGIDVIKGLVNGYNIDLAKLAESLGLKGLHAPASDAAKQPSNATQLPPEILQELNGLKQYIKEDKSRKALDRQNTVMQQIEGFRTATGKDGSLLHPHFADVEADMAILHQAALARKEPPPTLEQLYETAVWANPSTRALMTQAQRDAFEREAAEKEKERTEQARAKAEAAKKAGSSIRGAPGSGQAPDARRGGRSLRDDLMEAAEDL